MSYVSDSLAENEEIQYEASISLWSYALWICIGLGTLPLGGIGAGILFYIWLKNRCTEFVVTNKRVISKTGIISRKTHEISLKKIESMHVEQSIVGRFLNYGRLKISGTGVHNAAFDNISDPLEFRQEIQEAMDTPNKPRKKPVLEIEDDEAEELAAL